VRVIQARQVMPALPAGLRQEAPALGQRELPARQKRVQRQP
jgi:hypothetical protein